MNKKKNIYKIYMVVKRRSVSKKKRTNSKRKVVSKKRTNSKKRTLSKRKIKRGGEGDITIKEIDEVLKNKGVKCYINPKCSVKEIKQIYDDKRQTMIDSQLI